MVAVPGTRHRVWPGSAPRQTLSPDPVSQAPVLLVPPQIPLLQITPASHCVGVLKTPSLQVTYERSVSHDLPPFGTPPAQLCGASALQPVADDASQTWFAGQVVAALKAPL